MDSIQDFGSADTLHRQDGHAHRKTVSFSNATTELDLRNRPRSPSCLPQRPLPDRHATSPTRRSLTLPQTAQSRGHPPAVGERGRDSLRPRRTPGGVVRNNRRLLVARVLPKKIAHPAAQPKKIQRAGKAARPAARQQVLNVDRLNCRGLRVILTTSLIRRPSACLLPRTRWGGGARRLSRVPRPAEDECRQCGQEPGKSTGCM